MQSTTSPAAIHPRNLCTRCRSASNVARSFCDCLTPVCADCDAVTSEKALSWIGVSKSGHDVYLCPGCEEAREDAVKDAKLADARAIGLAKTTVHVEYTPRVDAVVTTLTAFTRRDWLDLALAALDQAGASVAMQNEIRDQMTDEGEEAAE